MEDQITVVSFCNGGDLMLWQIIDKMKVFQKQEYEKKEQVTVYKHKTEILY